MFLWESSKFLLVIICHMTRFSEIWSACFRLGAHQHKWSGRGNSFKCQKKCQESEDLPVSGKPPARLGECDSVLQSCKTVSVKYWKDSSWLLLFSDWLIHSPVYYSLSLLNRCCSNQEIPLHTFHFTPSTCFDPSPTSSSSWSFRLSFVWFFQLERFFFGPQSLFPRIPACNLSL